MIPTSLTTGQRPIHRSTRRDQPTQLTHSLKAASTTKKKETQMCIKLFTQYACGHAQMELMNRHCQCALIVGPVREVEGRCGRVECGGEPREDEGRVEGRRERGLEGTRGGCGDGEGGNEGCDMR